jgi:predicted nuclease with TOPRIM domain
LKKDVTSKNENINQLNIESVQLKTECETLKKDVTSKNENINQLNIESVQLKTEFDQLKTECETLKEEVNQLKEDVSIVDNLKENNVSFKKVGPFIICK